MNQKLISHTIQESYYKDRSLNLSKLPKPDKPEYAFIGRSNVGKSSLINSLLNRRNLSKTSKTPGKTKTIYHFLIDNTWYLVDLPGYGYSKIFKSYKNELSIITEKYLLNRENLMCIFLLIDSRHPPQAIDNEHLHWIGSNKLPFSIVFTKSDKLNEKDLAKNILHYKESFLKNLGMLS